MRARFQTSDQPNGDSMNTLETVALLRKEAEQDSLLPHAAKIIALCDALALAENQRDKATETVENIQGKVAMYSGKYTLEVKAREKAEAEVSRLREENERLLAELQKYQTRP